MDNAQQEWIKLLFFFFIAPPCSSQAWLCVKLFN